MELGEGISRGKLGIRIREEGWRWGFGIKSFIMFIGLEFKVYFFF